MPNRHGTKGGYRVYVRIGDRRSEIGAGLSLSGHIFRRRYYSVERIS